MDKKIGSLFLLTLLAVVHLDASVSLIAKDMYGKHVRQVSLGVPFTLEIQVVDGPSQEPNLGLPQEVQVIDRAVSSSYRSINGKTSGTRTYAYKVRIDQEGLYILGPAQISSLESNMLNVQVVKNAEPVQMKKPFFLEASAQPEKIYVGQQATFILRFYYATDGTTLEQIEDPAFNDCYASKMRGPTSGIEKRDGIDYKYLEWSTTICPKKTGLLVIPALACNVAVAAGGNRRASDMHSFMDMMFGAGRVERHYSNALSLDVLPLPKHKGPVHGVGNFTSYTAKVSVKEGSVGEGIVLTLELIGTGNTQAMVHPELVLSEHIKYYDSHAKEKMLSDLIKKKDFEYILQMLEPGDYTIPAQKITFFDPQTKRYKTLSTSPVTIGIKGSAQQVMQQEQTNQEHEVQVEDVDTLAPIYKASWRAGMPWRFIPWMWYYALLIGLLVAILLSWGYAQIALYRANHRSYYVYKRAFKKAHKKVAAIQLGNDAALLYSILKELFAERLQLPESLVSQELIETTLGKQGLAHEEMAKWNVFFNQLILLHFTKTGTVTSSLKQETIAWLNRLEKVLP